MSDANEVVATRGYFRSALACGMLMGVLSGGFEVLIYHFFTRQFSSFGNYFIIVVLYSSTNFLGTAILLSSAALYRRSWRLVGKAAMWSLGLTLLSGVSFYLPFFMAATLSSNWGFAAMNIVMMLLPAAINYVLQGFSAASLYGYPRFRWRFAGWASLVGLLYFAQYALGYATMGSDGMGTDMEALSTMGMLIMGPLMGLALAWPVEKLERERLGGGAIQR